MRRARHVLGVPVAWDGAPRSCATISVRMSVKNVHGHRAPPSATTVPRSTSSSVAAIVPKDGVEPTARNVEKIGWNVPISLRLGITRPHVGNRPHDLDVLRRVGRVRQTRKPRLSVHPYTDRLLLDHLELEHLDDLELEDL